MLIKRVVFEQIGFFDERFFMYYEDSDFSLRVRKAGFRMLIVPKARMWHSVSQSSQGSNSPNERYWMGRSSVLFFRKHIHDWRWFLIIPWRVGSTMKTTFQLLRRQKSASAKAYLKGTWEGMIDRNF
jgi:GT2 family glycosyltransferase